MGNTEGALHQSCNLKHRLRKLMPIVFHNLKQYDAHLIMHGLGKIENHQLNVIANNIEKYISSSVSKYYRKVRLSLQFINTYIFLSAFLQNLVNNLEKKDFTILKENMPNASNDLLLHKGVYPYEYIFNHKI